jgi:choline-sulfatase
MNRKAAPPNVIWIMGDEFRTDSLSCYGTPFPGIETPHIDSIAASGVRFANCFCNSPICVPSRASEMTARHPEETGVYGNEGSWASYSYDRDLVTFPEHFAANGYRTYNFGKTHLPVAMTPWQIDDHTGADLKTFYDGTDPADLTEEVYTPSLKAAIGGVFPEGVVFPGERVTRRSLEWIAAEAGGTQPFLTRISYLQPHSPVLPPKPYAGRYDNLPWPDRICGRPGSEYEQQFVDVMQASALDPQQVQRVRADYYALVKWLDDQVGRILDALRQADLLDNTIIVVEADHGVSLGERGRLQKHTFFPEVHRVPRIISFPAALPQGVVRADLAQNLDLARTLCGLCGIAPSDSFGGRDLFSGEPPPDHVFATVGYGEANSYALPNQVVGTWSDGTGWPRRACIRTGRYRLDMTVRRNGAPVPEAEEDPYLADLAIDPDESVNRIGDENYAEVASRLRRLLRDHCGKRYEPPFVPSYSAVERGIN